MMKLPGLRRAEPTVEVNDRDLVQWRLDIAQPLPRITREELLSRLWIDKDTLRGRSSISVGLEAEAMATA
jgi:hypothetical protein